MKNGLFEQLGTPEEIYDRPRTSYVASFVGEANILKGWVRSLDGDSLILDCGGGCVYALSLGRHWEKGEPVTVAVRSEAVDFTEDLSACGITARVKSKTFAGGMLRIELQLEDGTCLTASRHGINLPLKLGGKVRICWTPESAVPVDLEAAP